MNSNNLRLIADNIKPSTKLLFNENNKLLFKKQNGYIKNIIWNYNFFYDKKKDTYKEYVDMFNTLFEVIIEPGKVPYFTHRTSNYKESHRANVFELMMKLNVQNESKYKIVKDKLLIVDEEYIECLLDRYNMLILQEPSKANILTILQLMRSSNILTEQEYQQSVYESKYIKYKKAYLDLRKKVVNGIL